MHSQANGCCISVFVWLLYEKAVQMEPKQTCPSVFEYTQASHSSILRIETPAKNIVNVVEICYHITSAYMTKMRSSWDGIPTTTTKSIILMRSFNFTQFCFPALQYFKHISHTLQTERITCESKCAVILRFVGGNWCAILIRKMRASVHIYSNIMFRGSIS